MPVVMGLNQARGGGQGHAGGAIPVGGERRRRRRLRVIGDPRPAEECRPRGGEITEGGHGCPGSDSDAHVRPHHSVYGWIGHAVTFAESVTNLECDTDSRNANRVWDAAVGVDLSPQRAKVHADATG